MDYLSLRNIFRAFSARCSRPNRPEEKNSDEKKENSDEKKENSDEKKQG
jgi:hypothetical protein